MSLESICSQPIVVFSVTLDEDDPDEYGNPAENEVQREVLGWIAQAEAREFTVGQDVVVSDWTFTTPDLTLNLKAIDRIEYEGKVFEIVGEPDVAKTPRGPHHIEARLRVVT